MASILPVSGAVTLSRLRAAGLSSRWRNDARGAGLIRERSA